MPNDDTPYSLSHHATLRLAERKIESAGVALTIAKPTLIEPHPEDAAYRAIPEAGGES